MKTTMRSRTSRFKLTLAATLGLLLISGVVVYAAIIPIILGTGVNSDAPIIDGPATVTFRQLTTTPGDIGTWHYHPGVVHCFFQKTPCSRHETATVRRKDGRLIFCKDHTSKFFYDTHSRTFLE